MKHILLILLITITSHVTSQAQSITQERPSAALEAEVKEQTQELAKELGLRQKQALEFERLCIKYALLADEVLQSDLKENIKTKRLKELERKRVRATRNIFTKAQYDLYITQLNKI